MMAAFSRLSMLSWDWVNGDRMREVRRAERGVRPMTDFRAFCRESLEQIRAQRRYRTFTPLLKQAERFPMYRDAAGRDVVVLSSNDYLAMGGHPVVIDAPCEAARTTGAGARGRRNISGPGPLHDAP